MTLARHADPIAAIATAPGRGAVGIVRVSGRNVAPVIEALCGRALAPRHATLLPLRDADGSAIDHGIAIHFPAPHSYTGEDVLELQAHGGAVVLQLLLARCLDAGAALGVRIAEPGEFTERAFLNGKLDLAQAEAVADLIDASTEAAARSASRSLAGAFSAEIVSLREQLISLQMLVEATLDFPEEEIDFLQQADARGRLARITAAVDGVLGRARQGALLREGITVVLAGQPNVGKSSLLNALAGAELAIVTPIAGTTRDKVSETIQIEGVPLHVIDTAGLREVDAGDDAGQVERIGIERSWAAIDTADAVVFLHDLTRTGGAAYDAADAVIARRLLPHATGERLLHVYNKCDVVSKSTGAGGAADSTDSTNDVRGTADAGAAQTVEAANAAATGVGALQISAATGAGLDALRARLLALAGWHAQPDGVYIARTRHVHALRATRVHLTEAAAHADRADTALDLFAEELRLAQEALSRITGEFTNDDLLGEIFSRFCIGK